MHSLNSALVFVLLVINFNVIVIIIVHARITFFDTTVAVQRLKIEDRGRFVTC